MEAKNKITRYSRKSAMADLADFCIFASVSKDKGNHYVEVSEWGNGEGFDIDMESNKGSRLIQFTWGEFEAIRRCVKELYK